MDLFFYARKQKGYIRPVKVPSEADDKAIDSIGPSSYLSTTDKCSPPLYAIRE